MKSSDQILYHALMFNILVAMFFLFLIEFSICILFEPGLKLIHSLFSYGPGLYSLIGPKGPELPHYQVSMNNDYEDNLANFISFSLFLDNICWWKLLIRRVQQVHKKYNIETRISEKIILHRSNFKPKIYYNIIILMLIFNKI